MKRALAIGLIGLLAPMIQGALTGLLPAGWCPDTSLLLVTALGLAWPASLVGALSLVALHGFVCDLLSGSLLGQHALVSLCTFAAARIVSSQVNLHGAPSQMVLAAGLTAGTAFALNGLTAFFSPSSGPGLLSATALLEQVAVNSLLAPLAISGVRGLLTRLDDESGRRVLRLEPRRLSL